MNRKNKVMLAMIEYYRKDSKRIQHFIKVSAFARLIAEAEGLDETKVELIEIAGLVHDIGIKISEIIYQSSAGKYQEIEGPKLAKELLLELGFEDEFIERVCYLVGHHHTYSAIDGLDFQILVEADFLVNIAEEEINEKNVVSIRDKYFKTETGNKILDAIYLGYRE